MVFLVSVDTYLCPGCDKEVRVGSPCCPYCNPPAKRRKHRQSAATAGKDKHKRKKSWEVDPVYDGLDLPDEDFDYEDYVAREFGHKPHRKTGMKWYWWATAIGLLALTIFALFRWGHPMW